MAETFRDHLPKPYGGKSTTPLEPDFNITKKDEVSDLECRGTGSWATGWFWYGVMGSKTLLSRVPSRNQHTVSSYGHAQLEGIQGTHASYRMDVPGTQQGRPIFPQWQ